MWLEKFRKQTIMMKLGNTSILLDIKPVNIKAIEFATFFGYKLNHTPQGFTNIDSDFSKVKIAEEEKSENRKN